MLVMNSELFFSGDHDPIILPPLDTPWSLQLCLEQRGQSPVFAVSINLTVSEVGCTYVVPTSDTIRMSASENSNYSIWSIVCLGRIQAGGSL